MGSTVLGSSLDRLVESKKKYFEAKGREAGQHWAVNVAEYEELLSVAKAFNGVEDPDAHELANELARLGRPYEDWADGVCCYADFWIQALGLDEEVGEVRSNPPTDEFQIAFFKAAIEVFKSLN